MSSGQEQNAQNDGFVSMPNRIMLGIESSCDDTSIAVLRGRELLGQFAAVQHIHSKYGGVVPEFASRAHQAHIVPVLEGALKEAGCRLDQIDGIAYTRGPGLHGSLLVGSAFARSLAWSLGVPLYPVHHMRAHVVAHWMADATLTPRQPMMALTVSGGHTQLLEVRAPTDMQVIGTTMDDAAGEAFDKVAKMLGLPYPGGPEVDRLAAWGNPEAFQFTAPRMEGHNFSFSGVKTSVLRVLEKALAGGVEASDDVVRDMCASVQATIVAILCGKLEAAALERGMKAVAIQGGVSANSGLRKAVEELGKKHGWDVHIPPFRYCTDNGAMIALSGQYAANESAEGRLDEAPMARWPIA